MRSSTATGRRRTRRQANLAVFESYFARLIPDEAERTWMWHWLAHKARRPWIPMVAVIMVAEEFGSGRGTLFDILESVFGKDYVAPCSFGELTGKAPGARFNARLADALFVVVNEAVDEDGHQQSQRRTTYDALKNAFEPSPTARRRFEQKNQHVGAQRAAISGIIATQHTDVVKLPWDGRPVLQRYHLRREDDGGADSGDPGLDGGPGEYRGAPSSAPADAGGGA